MEHFFLVLTQSQIAFFGMLGFTCLDLMVVTIFFETITPKNILDCSDEEIMGYVIEPVKKWGS